MNGLISVKGRPKAG